MGQEVCHLVVVPDGEVGGEPRRISVTGLEQFLTELQKALLESQRGWAYVTIDSQKVLVSQPKQVFSLKYPDGKEVLVPVGNFVYSERCDFSTLEERTAR